nr:battenin [Halyomorpha halys]
MASINNKKGYSSLAAGPSREEGIRRYEQVIHLDKEGFPSSETPLCSGNRLTKYCEEVEKSKKMVKHSSEEKQEPQKEDIRFQSLLAFWILGLCNNYGYVVMLTAAHDILSHGDDDKPANNVRQCNTLSTGAILLADIIPSLVIKLIAPFFPLAIHFRMVMVLLLSSAGFILVAEATNEWIAIAGVICTALASGLGEVTLLSYIAFYKNKNVISAWSSGTGGAGFFGSFTYTGLNNFMSRTATLYSLLVVPALMGVSFWVMLEKPNIKLQSDVVEETSSKPNLSQSDDMNNYNDVAPLTASTETFFQKLKTSPSLLKYMIPLCLVYFFEYLINQGLAELVQFDIDWLSYKEQYKWYQVAYQIGVFVSRSSINLVKINKTWVLAFLQGINLILFATQAVYAYLPYFVITLLLVLWEGLLGGAAYVNTYNRISNEVPIEKQEFSMAFTSLSDAIGITLSGFIAIPVHNFICQLPKY